MDGGSLDIGVGGIVNSWLAQTGCLSANGRGTEIAKTWRWSNISTLEGSGISKIGVGGSGGFPLKRRESNIAGTGGYLAETLGD